MPFAIDLVEVDGLGGIRIVGWVLSNEVLQLSNGEKLKLCRPFVERRDVAEQFEDQIEGLDCKYGFDLLLPDISDISLFSGFQKLWESPVEQVATANLNDKEFARYVQKYGEILQNDGLSFSSDLQSSENRDIFVDFENSKSLPNVQSNSLAIAMEQVPIFINALNKNESLDSNQLDLTRCDAKVSRIIEYIFEETRDSKHLPSESVASETILIPVFNALDATRDCLRSLENIEGFADYFVAIVDDCSDSEVARFLETYSDKHSNVRYFRTPNNSGFLQACTFGLSKIEQAHDVILLNSDVVLSKRSLKLLRKGVYSRANVAAGSCLSSNSPNCLVPLPYGFSLEQFAVWIEQSYEPSYPTLITPEGQCLYLKRWAIEKFGFFDPEFGKGFGEESDLCMRMYMGGADTICVDNAYILHRKSASFGEAQGEELKRKHWPLFQKRWGREHQLLYKEFVRKNPLAHLRSLAHRLQPENLPKKEASYPHFKPAFKNQEDCNRKQLPAGIDKSEVVFFLPNTYVGGGTFSVFQHAKELEARGIVCRIVVVGKPFTNNFNGLSSVMPMEFDECLRYDWKGRKLIATFWTTAFLVQKLVERSEDCSGFYYVQGYEPGFYESGSLSSQQAFESYALGLTAVVKSNSLLSRLASDHQITALKIAAGINRYIFYPGKQADYEGPIRICAYYRPETPDRGAKMVEEVLCELLESNPELEVRLFGEDKCFSQRLGERVEYKGMIALEKVAALYRESDISFDFADFHGFGRLGIESMSCGVVPVLTQSGGVNEYAVDGKNAFLGQNKSILLSKTRQLIADPSLRRKMRKSALMTSQTFSEAQACNDWMEILGFTR